MIDADRDVHRLGKSLLAGALELRSRAVKAVFALIAIFASLTPFSDRVFSLVAEPVMAKMPAHGSMIARGIASPFMTPLRATFWVALFVSMPFILYQVWRLVDGWLPASKRRIAPAFIAASAVLFYTGVAFAFFLVLPMAFKFFQSVTPTHVRIATDISAYLDFTIGMSLAFGFAFQVPIAIIVIVWTGLVSRQTLAKGRPYVFLAAFVIGMVLTPPDPVSQTILALPMYLLFEGALFICARFLPDAPPPAS
ncbi:MAG TPA: twin-arginine translocase subunit TatC [Gammaproteobacteria bacterium]|nr:twin-arginine translocase subunit TatC [Gammaproteobacteria bacterium]